MRLFRLFLLSMRKGTYIRSKCVVWFLMSVFIPSIICMYWVIALRDNPELGKLFSTSQIITYYITTVLLNALLVSHMKEHIMRYDIQDGALSRYLLKPQSYYWYNIIFNEIPYRIIQGLYGIIVIALIVVLFPGFFNLGHDKAFFMLGVISGIMGFFICANIEIILGLLAFWFYDLKLVHNAYEVIFIMLGGINIPLYLFPHFIEQIAFFTPLPYILYVPTLLLTGQVASSAIGSLMAQQTMWLAVTSILYLIIWKRGIRVYTASGS